MRPLYFLSIILLSVSSCSFTGSHPKPEAPHHPGGVYKPLEEEAAVAPAPVPEAAPVAATGINAKYKIALLVPLTGKSAGVGKAISEAAQMAVFESGNPDFQVVPYDTGDTTATTNAAADLAIANGASIILGPVFSDKVSGVASKARAAGIKVISFSNNRAVAGGNVYIMGLMPDQQVTRILKYASDRGVGGFSAAVPNNLFGNQVAELFQKDVSLFGGTVRKISLYSGASPDYALVGKEIGEAYTAKSVVPDRKAEAVLIPEAGGKLPAVLNSLKAANITPANIRVLGSALWDNEATITNPRLRGAWYTGTPYEDSDSFIGRFMTNYSYKPEDIAGLGYDAVNLAIETAPSGFSDSDLRRGRGFHGVKGIYRFDGSNVNVRGYAIYEIQSGAAHVVDPAPDHF